MKTTEGQVKNTEGQVKNTEGQVKTPTGPPEDLEREQVMNLNHLS